MKEVDMERLIWTYPKEFFGERLTPFTRQQTFPSGRIDIVFRAPSDDAMVIAELKRGTPGLSTITQLLRYESDFIKQHPRARPRLMAIANDFPQDLWYPFERAGIECCEISEERFRKVAADIGYRIVSDIQFDGVNTVRPASLQRDASSFSHYKRVPTPGRQARRNPYKPGSYIFEVFEIAKSGLSLTVIHDLATKDGAYDHERRVQWTLTQLLKGVRRRGGKRDGHYSLAWDVNLDGIAIPINGSLGSAPHLQSKIIVSNIRRIDGNPFDF